MIYAAYRDDGPKGYCAQTMSITRPYHTLFRFHTYDEFREGTQAIVDHAKKSRHSPRFDGAWSDSLTQRELTGLEEVRTYQPPQDDEPTTS